MKKVKTKKCAYCPAFFTPHNQYSNYCPKCVNCNLEIVEYPSIMRAKNIGAPIAGIRRLRGVDIDRIHRVRS